MAQHKKPSTDGTSPFRIAGRALSFCALVITALAAIVLIVVPMASGSQSYSVLTNSMKPNYGPGTFLVVKPTAFDSLKVGDVITYQIESGRPDVITHRILSVGADQEGNRTVLTKGDNNDLADENPVTEVQVRGKLFYAVPYAGVVANWLGNQDRGAFGKVLAVGFILYGAITMASGLRKRRVNASGSPKTSVSKVVLSDNVQVPA